MRTRGLILAKLKELNQATTTLSVRLRLVAVMVTADNPTTGQR